LLRTPVRRLCAAPPLSPPAAAKEAISSLFRRGSGRRRTGPGQPKVVAVVTGGGGSFFSWMLAEPGASSCLLEGRLPYGKESTDAFLAEHGRSAANNVGFCSPEMSALLAAAARDRAIMLTPRVALWPDAIGVASTATIVSHYQRRGSYRVHAAACTGSEAALALYTHQMVKGARERAAEDSACALLTLRALADAAALGAPAEALATCGVRLDDTPAANAVGEAATGIEEVPVRLEAPPSTEVAASPRVFIPTPGATEAYAVVPLPLNGSLPPGTLVVPWDDRLDSQGAGAGAAAAAGFAAAAEALSALGVHGDGGGDGAWSVPQAPVLLEAPTAEHAAAYLDDAAQVVAAASHLENWAILSTEQEAGSATEEQASVKMGVSDGGDDLLVELPPPRAHRALSGKLPPGTAVLISPAAAHDLVASVLAHWENGESASCLANLIARGGKLVVARGTDPSDAALEAEAREAVESELPPDLRTAFAFVSDRHYDGRVSGLSDGSPSTDGVDGTFVGGWDPEYERPQGRGVMRWDNGIVFDGLWSAGKYEGYGTKSYSRGGGYEGMWREGKRCGYGTSRYDGKFGYEKWVGPFVDDLPHGVGTMYLQDITAVKDNLEGKSAVPFEFVHGEPQL
jgi:hypothetical protein